MIAVQIAASPEHLARGSVQACGTVSAVMHVDTAGFDGRRGRGVAIAIGDVLGLFRVENLHVMDHLSVGLPDGHGKHVMAVGGGGGHPNLAVPNHG